MEEVTINRSINGSRERERERERDGKEEGRTESISASFLDRFPSAPFCVARCPPFCSSHRPNYILESGGQLEACKHAAPYPLLSTCPLSARQRQERISGDIHPRHGLRDSTHVSSGIIYADDGRCKGRAEGVTLRRCLSPPSPSLSLSWR